MTLAAGTRIGKYVVHRKLAEGGMAEIFLASAIGPEGFEKQVVIKRIRSGYTSDPLFVEMFISEARLVSKLNHANIVQIFDFDRHDDSFYIAMEYVRGRSLADAQQRAKELDLPISPLLAAEIAAEIARGLSFAHRLTDRGQPLNIVHRDVTPHNVLLSYEGAVKLTDFGIAKSGARPSTIGALKGKFAYMSPEQSRGEPVDHRTDVFALGITLWELLTGSRLFGADSDVGVLRAVQEREILPPHLLNPAVGEELGGIVAKALERQREDRYPTAAEFERALTRYVVSEAQNPDQTDVGLWMHELFPVEAARTEETAVQSASTMGRLRGSTLGSGSPMSADPGVQVQSGASFPPLAQSGGRYDPTVPLGPAASRPSPEVSHLTPVVLPAEGQTQRTLARAPRWGRFALLLGCGVVLAATGVAVIPRVFHRDENRSSPAPAIADQPVVLKPTPEGVEPPPSKPPPMASPASTEPAPASASEAPPKRPVNPTSKERIASKHSSRQPAAVAAPAKAAANPSVSPGSGPKSASSGPPGKLVLTVSPWGEVFIDGKSIGEQVGRREHDLPPGEHLLEVQGPSSWGPKSITIQSGQRTSQAVLFN